MPCIEPNSLHILHKTASIWLFVISYWNYRYYMLCWQQWLGCRNLRCLRPEGGPAGPPFFSRRSHVEKIFQARQAFSYIPGAACKALWWQKSHYPRFGICEVHIDRYLLLCLNEWLQKPVLWQDNPPICYGHQLQWYPGAVQAWRQKSVCTSTQYRKKSLPNTWKRLPISGMSAPTMNVCFHSDAVSIFQTPVSMANCPFRGKGRSISRANPTCLLWWSLCAICCPKKIRVSQ